MRAAIVALSAMLSACASTPPAPPMEWVNSGLDGHHATQQFFVDDGYCIQASHGSVVMPRPRAFVPGVQSYKIQGRVTTTDQSYQTTTSDYEATVTPQRSGFDSFSQGLAAGQHNRAVHDAHEQRQRVYRGCMASLGWSLQPGR